MAEGRTREIKISIPEELCACFIPEMTVKHINNARKEFLLALRSLIDHRIEALEKKETRKTATKKKIKID